MLDHTVETEEDISFPASSILNLAGNIKENQPLLRLRFNNGQTILAKPTTKLVIQDKSGTIPVFTEEAARDVEVGDRVCIIGQAFIEMARPLLNITVRAAEEIRDYHQLVLERFALLSGNNISERLRHLVKTMNLPDVTEQRARYWVVLQDQLGVPLEDAVANMSNLAAGSSAANKPAALTC